MDIGVSGMVAGLAESAGANSKANEQKMAPGKFEVESVVDNRLQDTEGERHAFMGSRESGGEETDEKKGKRREGWKKSALLHTSRA